MSPLAARGVHDPQSFDHLAARYDRYGELVGAELRAWLLFHLPPRADRALDAGCGTGLHTDVLADRCDHVLAVDLSAPMLTYACRRRPHPNVDYTLRDLHEVTPAGDGPFDVVLSAYTLHHVPDLPAALRHLRALTRPGGTVLLVDVVDDRHPVPRSWLRAEAWRTFRTDLARRRRPVAEAAELLRLSLDPDWLDHQSTDRLLPGHQWDAVARDTFPGAGIVQLDRARALHWRRRDDDRESAPARRSRRLRSPAADLPASHHPRREPLRAVAASRLPNAQGHHIVRCRSTNAGSARTGPPERHRPSAPRARPAGRGPAAPPTPPSALVTPDRDTLARRGPVEHEPELQVPRVLVAALGPGAHRRLRESGGIAAFKRCHSAASFSLLRRLRSGGAVSRLGEADGRSPLGLDAVSPDWNSPRREGHRITRRPLDELLPR